MKLIQQYHNVHRTLAKVSVMGTTFMDELRNDIDDQFIPSE